MSSKLRSFRYSVYAHKRGHFDDPEVPVGRFLPPDVWLELRGAVLMPSDPRWWDGKVERPDWDQGAFYAEAKSGRKVAGTVMGGRPMELLIENWEAGLRCCDGVLILTECEEKPMNEGLLLNSEQQALYFMLRRIWRQLAVAVVIAVLFVSALSVAVTAAVLRSAVGAMEDTRSSISRLSAQTGINTDMIRLMMRRLDSLEMRR